MSGSVQQRRPVSWTRGVGLVQLAEWMPTVCAAGGAECTPGTPQGTGTRGGANVEGGAGGRSRERPGAPGAGGPAREGSGALCADSGVQPRGSAVWTGGRGAESVVVQAEPTAGADVSVSSPRWKSPARGNAAPKAAAVGRTGFAVRPSHSRRGHDGAVAGRNRWPGGPRVTLTTSRAGGSLGQHPPGTCQPHSSEGGRRVEGACAAPGEACTLPAAPSCQPRARGWARGWASVSWWQTWAVPRAPCRAWGLRVPRLARCRASSLFRRVGHPWVRPGNMGGPTRQHSGEFPQVVRRWNLVRVTKN